MATYVTKRDGERVFCDGQKILRAIEKASRATGETIDCMMQTDIVLKKAEQIGKESIHVETIQDIVEQTLMENAHHTTAKAYILYRRQREKTREEQAFLRSTTHLFNTYLGQENWKIKENANMTRSVNGMNNFIRESFTTQYWLGEIYPEEVREAHQSGLIHIHDLGFFGPYCAGWDLRQLLLSGFGGVDGKLNSSPPKHLRSFLAQIVNSTFTTQGECAGAQAWSSIDTYCAPFIRYDNLTFKEVKQTVQEFVYSLNVPTRVGFQSPFSNITLDMRIPARLAEQAVIVGGELREACYGDFQKEADMFNSALFEVMSEGDASGRVFTFPIPTINITKDFPWDSPIVDSLMTMTNTYGIPYFSNYVNSDLDPDDALSMCCRLRLDTRELKKRGGGLFGSNPLTGSIGVVTLNLPRIAYISRNEEEFFTILENAAQIAKTSLEIKRKIIERETERGMYPFSANYLSGIREREGAYWAQHFATIGIVGMHEALLNLFGEEGALYTPKGHSSAKRILSFLRDRMSDFQAETGHGYNLEATPGEGTSYSLALKDTKEFPHIITSGEHVPYYTNSSQLPVMHTSDIIETLENQDELQSLYTGGTVLHLYLGEKIESTEVTKQLIQRIFSSFTLPYLSITPTFSTCRDHGYIKGEIHSCPVCGKTTEVWTRVVGYLRPVGDFHQGKQEEHRQRVPYKVSV